MTLEKLNVIVAVVVGLLAIWEGGARIVGGDGPITIVQEIGDWSTPAVPTVPTVTDIANGKHLDKPSGVSLSGDCENGFTLTWQPVEGAEKYRIEGDSMFNGTEHDTNHSIPAFPDEKQHSYRVFAEAFPDSRSEGSDEVITEACSF